MLDRSVVRPEDRVTLACLRRLVVQAVLREELTLAQAGVLLALWRVPAVAQLGRICALFLGD